MVFSTAVAPLLVFLAATLTAIVVAHRFNLRDRPA